MSDFINPYNFVRASKQETQRLPYLSHDRFQENHHSGKIECILEVRTPLFIPDPDKTRWESKDVATGDQDLSKNETIVFKVDGKQIAILRKHNGTSLNEGEYIGTITEVNPKKKVCKFTTSYDLGTNGHKMMEFFRYDGSPAIPPTSLKGMIRSVVEAASNSCFSQFEREKLGKRLDPESRLIKINSGLLPCSDHGDLQMLCPACRMFGVVLQSKQRESDKETAYAGRIVVGMGRVDSSAPELTSELIPLHILSSPKPTYAPFYVTNKKNEYLEDYNRDDSYLRGRKFYFHIPNTAAETVKRESGKRDNQNSSVELLTKGTFRFTVDFENLSEYELGLLLYALQLEEGMMHKLGMGKPLGLGSAKITIDHSKSFLINRKKRYQTLWLDDAPEMTGEDELDVDKFIKAFKAKQSGAPSNASDNDIEQKFSALAYIADLRTLLSFNNWQDVKYPRAKDKRGNLAGYAWFSWNKTQKQPLPTASETKNGKKLTGWE